MERCPYPSIFLFLLSVLTGMPQAILGQSQPYVHPDYVVRHWSIEDGLPVNHINDMVQGQDGYLWLATFDGLVRFDGKRFTVFNTTNTPALVSNRMLGLFEEASGARWITNEDGSVVRHANGTFTSFPVGEALVANANALYQDADTVWVLTDGGVMRYAEGMLVSWRPDLLDDNYSDMLRDHTGVLWFFGQHGLVRMTPSGAARRFTTADGLPRWREGFLGGDEGGMLFEDQQGTLWAGTHWGMARLEGDRFVPLPSDIWQPTGIYAITEEPSGTLWFATACCGWLGYEEGTFRPFVASDQATEGELFMGASLETGVDGARWRAQGKWLYRNRQPIMQLDALQKAFYSAYTLDQENNVWIAAQGLYRLRPRPIQVLSTPEGLPGANVYPVLETQDGSIWMGIWTDNGLTRFHDGSLSTYDLNGRDPLIDDLVSALHEDRNGTLWVGTLGALCRMEAGRCVRADLPDAYAIQVSALHEDRQGRLWTGNPYGLNVGRPTASGRHWVGHPLNHGVHAIVEAASGDILFGTLGSGLGRYHEDGEIEWLTTAHGLASDYVRDVYEDAAHVLWIATQDRGLCRLDRQGQPQLQAGVLHCLDTDDGLFDNSLHRILEDDYGRFWMSTNRGLFWVDQAELNAFAQGTVSTVTSVSYIERDGMRNREANGARQPAGIKASDGRLWFPTQDGVVIVNPAQVQRPVAPPVVIETITVGDSTFQAKGEVSLKAGIRDLDIRYTALAFSRPEDVRFRFMLEGYDEVWKEGGEDRQATYTNLPPGSYTFLVNAGLGGVWSAESTSMEIVRQPYVWETRWFYGLSGLVVVLLVLGGFRYRVRRLKERQDELEKIVAERTAQLQQANELKSRFLVNISHEFRTPLTLTFGPINDLLKGQYQVDPKALPLLERARTNGQRLLRLINQLLDLSRLDAGALMLQKQPRDLNRFLRETTAVFESFARTQQVGLHYEAPEETLLLQFDPDKLEKVVVNLISNALKFTPARGKVAVKLRREDEETVMIEVADTGRGIPAAHLPHIFDRFYQVEASDTRIQEGTGIGLALVKELVTLHEGTIAVESTEGFGTRFEIRLPMEDIPVETVPVPGDGAVANVQELMLPEASTAVPATSEATEAHPLVLIVEDNPDMRFYIRAHLQPQFQLAEAENGKAGLEQAAALQPDLVLSDVMMPEMDGVALCAALKAERVTSHIPVVLLTAKSDVDSRIAGYEGGADAYLAKPFDAEELRVRVRTLIDARRQLQARFAGSPDLVQVAEEAALPPAEIAFLQQIEQTLTDQLGNAQFGVDHLAESVGLGRRQLHRKLQGLTGETPGELIRRRRIEHAASLLREGIGSVKAAMYESGFQSKSAFARAFKDHFGVSPSAYGKG